LVDMDTPEDYHRVRGMAQQERRLLEETPL
jgi:hypothetical protein